VKKGKKVLLGHDRNIMPFLRDSTPLESRSRSSRFEVRGAAIDVIRVPVLEECCRVGI